MRRRYTILETVKPVQHEFGQLAGEWRADASKLMLGWIWAGYDLLAAEILSSVNWDLAEDDLERELTELLRSHQTKHAFGNILLHTA